jgi:hypothetical protein
MMASQSQGEIGIERMCQLAGICRSGYYRHWRLSAPRQEETGRRDAIQRLALKHRHRAQISRRSCSKAAICGIPDRIDPRHSRCLP